MNNLKKLMVISVLVFFILSSLFCKVDDAKNKTLTVSITGSGTVVVTVDGEALTGSSPYSIEEGKEATLTAIPASETDEYLYDFTAWSDDFTGSTKTATITMDADKSVTATFTSTEKLYQTVDSTEEVGDWEEFDSYSQIDKNGEVEKIW